MDDSRPDILEKILRRKHEEIAERSKTVSIDELKTQAAQADPVRGFIAEDPGGYTIEFFAWQ